MDERAIIEWIENIFKPYIEMAPENIFLLLVMDYYRCRIMTLVVEAI